MVGYDEVLRQFHRLGVRPRIWARAEMKELCTLLVPGEQLTNVVFGWYENGFALLCCTDQRVLLLDKKPFFLKMEDLRYDKISEVRFLSRLLDSSLILSYSGQKLDFKSWDQPGLRKLLINIQESIMRINQQQMQANNLEHQTSEPVATTRPWAATEPQAAGLSYEISYPESYMQDTRLGVALPRNPYAPTNKFLRRRAARFS